MLPQVEFVYNATRALRIEHTPFEANFGFSQQGALDLLFNMRPSILVSHDASMRLRLLQEVHALVHSIYNYTRIRCKLVRNRRQPHTSFEEKR
jgi:hypothetical protein